MDFSRWDILEVSLAEYVLEDQVPARVAVVNSCKKHPSAPVQYLTLALASMTAVLEPEWQAGSLPEKRGLLELYRTVVALSADIAVMDLNSSGHLLCIDLLTHWAETKDTFFSVESAG